MMAGTALAASSVQTPQENQRFAANPDQFQETAGAKVLLVQDESAWWVYANEHILDSLGELYDVVGSQSLRTVQLDNYKTIIIASSQSQRFYDAIKPHQARVGKWLKEGARTLQFNGADQGWSSGEGWSVVLPRGVSRGGIYGSNTNKVVKKSSPLVVGVPVALEGSYASHTYLANPPKGSVVARDDQGNATLIDYCHGKSRVIATGLTLEIAHAYGWFGPMLTNILKEATQKPGCPTP